MSETRDTQPDAITPERLEAAGLKQISPKSWGVDCDEPWRMLNIQKTIHAPWVLESHAPESHGLVRIRPTTMAEVYQAAALIGIELASTPAAPAAERVRELEAERDRLKRQRDCLQIERDHALAACNEVFAGMEWNGDGYEWNPESGDYRERVVDPVERGARKIMDELKELRSQNAALEQQVAAARARLLTAAGDDLCRLSQEEIKAMSAGEVKIPPKDEFLASCERFHSQVAGEVGVNSNCLTMAQLLAENEKQRQQLAAARGERDRLRAAAECFVKGSDIGRAASTDDSEPSIGRGIRLLRAALTEQPQ